MSLERVVYEVTRGNPRSLVAWLLGYPALNLILLKMLPPAMPCKLTQTKDFDVLKISR